MINRSKNKLFPGVYFLLWMIVAAGAPAISGIAISKGEEGPYPPFPGSHTDRVVYPLRDFELPADNDGRIDTILLRNRHKRYIANVVKATSPHVKVIVFVERQEIGVFKETLTSFLREQNISPARMDKLMLLPLDSKQPYWMRDNGILFVNRQENLITFVACKSQSRKDVFLDEYIRSSSSDNIVLNDSKVVFDFPGGEIVASKRYVFCKGWKLAGNGNPLPAKEQFEKLCKKELIDFGLIKTPDSHIDLWLTPIDDKTVLLGDVSLGKEIVGNIPKSERSGIVNKFIKAERADGYIRKRGAKHCKKFFYKMIFENRDNAPEGYRVEMVKGYLEKMGISVILIPSIGHLDIHPDSYYSYNNVLMESYAGDSGRIIKNVILPEYGHPLDEKVKLIWESLGFVIKQFPMNNIARKGGAIRCSSQRVPGSVCYMEDGK